MPRGGSRPGRQEAATVLRRCLPVTRWRRPCGLACAYLKMGGTNEATLALLGRRGQAEQRGCLGVTCFALIVEGVGLVTADHDGMLSLEESLRIARDAGLPGAADEAYSCILEACAKLQRFADSERYYAEGLAYCEGRELGVFSICINGWRARTLLLLGRWDEAAQICAQMLGSPGISPVNQLNPLYVLGTIWAPRRGRGTGVS